MIQFKNKPGLVVYVTCGDPDLRASRQVVLAAIDAGADVIELGVPFSDPLADGPVIQRASERALAKGTTLRDVLHLAADVRNARPHAGLIIFSYLNPIYRYGMKEFAEDAKSSGIDGALVIDLTLEESAEYRALMSQHGLGTILLAAPTSTDARLKKIAQASTGFVYAVSRTGITGASQELSLDAASLVKRLKKYTRLPVAVGFGISTPAHFRQVGLFADAAVVGSAIVRLIEENPAHAAAAVSKWIKSLKPAGGMAAARG